MTADEFLTAAAVLLGRDGLQELFLHNAEGAPFAVILPIDVYQEKVTWAELPEGDMPYHDHLEPGMEMPQKLERIS